MTAVNRYQEESILPVNIVLTFSMEWERNGLSLRRMPFTAVETLDKDRRVLTEIV